MYKTLKDVIFVTKGKYEPGVNTFVVEKGNKGQLETALNWAGNSYEVFDFSNDNFNARISRAADKSYSQGGKLSFWTLEIGKDGKTFSVGINSDMLIECIKTSVVDCGSVVGKMAFIKDGTKLGIAETSGDLWKQALEADVKRDTLKKRKTSNPTPGVLHETVKNSNVLICKLYEWYSEESVRLGPFTNYIYLDSKQIKKWDGQKLSEALKDEDFLELLGKSIDYGNLYNSNITITIPSRAEGRMFLEVDVEPIQICYALNELRNKTYEDFIKKDKCSNYKIPGLLRMSFSDELKPDIDDVLQVASIRYEEYNRQRELARLGY